MCTIVAENFDEEIRKKIIEKANKLLKTNENVHLIQLKIVESFRCYVSISYVKGKPILYCTPMRYE